MQRISFVSFRSLEVKTHFPTSYVPEVYDLLEQTVIYNFVLRTGIHGSLIFKRLESYVCLVDYHTVLYMLYFMIIEIKKCI